MKKSIPKYLLKPLVAIVLLDILLILLRWFTPLNFAVNSPKIVMRILGFLMYIGIMMVSFSLLFTIAAILFEFSETKKRNKQLADGTIINIEDIGEFYRHNWSPDCYSKTETLPLFGKEHKITIQMEAGSKETPIADAQIKAYHEFMESYSTYQAELENILRTQEFDEIFKMADIIFNSSGDYKMVASDTTSDDSDCEFIVTFNPVNITLQQIDYSADCTRHR